MTDITITPYDLLANPYGGAHQIIVLEARTSRMVDSNGNKLPVHGIGESLKFNRMIDKGIALYDVVESHYYYGRYGGIEAGVAGQIAVDLPPGGAEATSDIGVTLSIPPNAEIPPRYPWNIQRLGILEGTNGFGAPISVPHVKFLSFNTTPEHRYTPEEMDRRQREETEKRYKQENHGPALRSNVSPKYTSEALDSRLEGVVSLVMTVGADGKPRDIRVLESHGRQYAPPGSTVGVAYQPLGHGLEAAAVQCMQDSTFNPAVRGGQPVDTPNFEVRVGFRLPDELRR
jgi:hypothetical protein